MKKMYTLILGIILSFVGYAQPLTSQWVKLANATDYAWFTNDNNVASIAYNPATDRLLVSKRNDRIFIVNPATGAEVGQLNTTGWGTESFKANKIRVTSDGVIYAISLATGAGQCKIYRWADQASTPTLCADFTVTERCGDAFGISGTGNNTILYASGSGTTSNAINIYMLNTVNGLNFFVESNINIATTNVQWANRTVEPVSNSLTSDLWFNMGGGPARRVTVGTKSGNTRTGTLAFATTDGVGNGQASNGYGGLKLLTTSNNNKFLIFAGGNNSNAGLRVKMLNVTDEALVTTYGIDSIGDASIYVSNANGTGDAAYKDNGDNTFTIFQLSTNNGLQATKTDAGVLPVNISSFNASLKNKSVLISWTTLSETNNKGFEIQKSVNGKDFSSIGFMNSKTLNGTSNEALNYSFDDSKLLNGKSYYRLKQLDKDGKFSLSNIQVVEYTTKGMLTVKALENPVRNNIGLSIQTAEKKNIQINITDASGKVVYGKFYTVTVGDNTIILPTIQLPKGSLFVTVKDVENNNEVTTLQLIKL